MATSSDLADRFEVSEQTIRNWSNEFASFLSPDATPPGDRAPRFFTPEDELILSTVATLRIQRKSYAEISGLLQEGYRDERPQEQSSEDPTTALTRWQMQEVIGQQREQIATLKGRYEEAQEQAQRREADLEGQLVNERNARLDAEKRAVRAETRLELHEHPKGQSTSSAPNTDVSDKGKSPARWWEIWKKQG